MTLHAHPPQPPADGDSVPEIVKQALGALQRSALRARRVAAQTGTRLVTVENGEIVYTHISPEDLPPDA